MITSEVTYLGGLRTQAHHIRSGEKIITDAPPDNNGRGEAFSPTDLTATSLGSCMLTLMGIAANTHKIDGLEGTRVEITKIMGTEPRRITEIIASVYFPVSSGFSEHDKKILEKAALTCPVTFSLHADIKQDITFHY